MRVKVVKRFAWAPDGNNVQHIEAGQVLEGAGAQACLDMKAGELLGGPPPAAEAPPQSVAQVVELRQVAVPEAAQEPEEALPEPAVTPPERPAEKAKAAPTNKARSKASKRKG